MARTYVLNATSLKGGYRNGWSSNVWTNYAAYSSRRCAGGGGIDKNFYATLILFDAAQLAELRTKTIQSVTLTVNVKSGYIPGKGTNDLPVSHKANSSESSWERTSTYHAGYLRKTSGSASPASNTTMNLVLDTVVPAYGYVIGPNSYSVSASLYLNNTATLTVVTDEAAEYTVTYNANGGSGAPEPQTKAQSETLILSNVWPVRSGYVFTGWNTASDGTGTSYAPGASYIQDEDVTLYAQWTSVSGSVWVKGSDNAMHQGTVYVKGSDNAMHDAAVYVKGSDNAMHQSS